MEAMDRNKIIDLKSRIEELSKEKPNFDSVEEMAKDVWLFLTNDKMPEKATIKREALIHEVTAMLETARQHFARQVALLFVKWCIKEGWTDFDGVDCWINVGKGRKVLSTIELYGKFATSAEYLSFIIKQKV